ncbi:CotO family spore coat protein [Oceanobacillus halophilus]|uniref:Spore coat protein CotO n=1 Tax=Oceanobacillus halophilus TaxID=930130 RepID=A0A495A035_9BACI|nr:CotO family spore coat protein [Oceanobacillus halophilus]RKQ32641.1 hypothetical protein D8M06_11930 [Oceanobacillus halophilus]
MGEKRYANDPMLFIHQPQVSAPKAPMQNSYVSPKRSKKKPVEPSSNTEPVKEIPKRRYSARKSMKDETAVEKEIEEEEPKQDETTSKRKQFKDMTTRERILYFTNTSEYAPKLKCEIKTDNKSHRGVILNFKDEIVEMQVGRRAVKIPFEEIKQVRMLGF